MHTYHRTQALVSVNYLLHMGLDRKDRRSSKTRRLDMLPLDSPCEGAGAAAGAAVPQDSGNHDDGLDAAAGGSGAVPGGGAQLPADALMLEMEVHHPEVRL